MPRSRPRQFEFHLSETERAQLTALAGSRALPYGLVRRAQIILWSAACRIPLHDYARQDLEIDWLADSERLRQLDLAVLDH